MPTRIRKRKPHTIKNPVRGKRREPFRYGYYGRTLSRGEMVENFKREGYSGHDVELALRLAEGRAREAGKNVITDMDLKYILDIELPKMRRMKH